MCTVQLLESVEPSGGRRYRSVGQLEAWSYLDSMGYTMAWLG
jgi:hypothetical protein